MPSHPIAKGTCLIVGDSNIGWNRQKPLKDVHCQITSFCTLQQMMLLVINQQKFWKKFIGRKRIYKINISTLIKQYNHGKASLTISHLSKKFKDISTSIVNNSNIGDFYLNSSGLHLNDKGLGRLAINQLLKIHKLQCELKPLIDGYEKEMLDAKNNNIQSQKNITAECSALNKVAIKVDIKSSLGNLKL